MTVTPEQRQRILHIVEQRWNELLEAVDRLELETIHAKDVAGQWSIKDILGHVAAWDRVALKRIALAESGERRRLIRNLHAFNREQAEARREKSYQEIRREMDETHQELVRALESSPVITRNLIRADTYDHYRARLNDIEAGLARLRGTGDQQSASDPSAHSSPGT